MWIRCCYWYRDVFISRANSILQKKSRGNITVAPDADHQCCPVSGQQRRNNIDQTHLVLLSGKLMLQKHKDGEWKDSWLITVIGHLKQGDF